MVLDFFVNSTNRACRARDVVDFLGSDVSWVRGDVERRIAAVSSLKAKSADYAIAFYETREPTSVDALRSSLAGTIVCDHSVDAEVADKTLIGVKKPRLAFAKIVQHLCAKEVPRGIHSSARVEPGADIHETAYVGPMCYVPADCTIGEASILWSSVTLYPQVRIGNRVTIHSGAVLGSDGFGYERTASGALIKFPQLGRLLIEDDVEIGANTSINRGALDDTVIGTGCKIDDLVYIAHNVVVSKHSLIVANTTVCGSVFIGERCWIASSILRNGISVGNDVTVGLGSVVIHDVPDNVVVYGNPARVAPKHASS